MYIYLFPCETRQYLFIYTSKTRELKVALGSEKKIAKEKLAEANSVEVCPRFTVCVMLWGIRVGMVRFGQGVWHYDAIDTRMMTSCW